MDHHHEMLVSIRQKKYLDAVKTGDPNAISINLERYRETAKAYSPSRDPLHNLPNWGDQVTKTAIEAVKDIKDILSEEDPKNKG